MVRLLLPSIQICPPSALITKARGKVSGAVAKYLTCLVICPRVGAFKAVHGVLVSYSIILAGPLLLL